jgi:hypothetical protein
MVQKDDYQWVTIRGRAYVSFPNRNGNVKGR